MRYSLRVFFAIVLFAFSLQASGQSNPAGGGKAKTARFKEGVVRFNHRLRPESPRWPDGRYYEKYTFRGAAGDRVVGALAGEQSGDNPPKPHDHLLLYVDRGEGLEPIRADREGFEADLSFEREAEYIFYVVSRRPAGTGAYTFFVATRTAKEPPPVFYHMIFEGALAANYQSRRPLDVDTKGHSIPVRVEATGFKPVLDTVRYDNGARNRVVFQGAQQGANFASTAISTLDAGKWDIVVTNESAQSGTFRLVIEYPNLVNID